MKFLNLTVWTVASVRCQGVLEQPQQWKIVSPWEEISSATMDWLLLRLQERFPVLKSSLEHNTYQEFELLVFDKRKWAGQWL